MWCLFPFQMATDMLLWDLRFSYSSRCLAGCGAAQCCGKVPTDRRTITEKMEAVRSYETWYPNTSLPHGPPKGWYLATVLYHVTTWRWRQHGAPKRWYFATTLHDVTTWRWKQHGPPKRWHLSTPVHDITTWRRKQHGPPKRWYFATTLHDVTTWTWKQHGPPKRWYPTTSLHGVSNQKISSWNITAVEVSKLAWRYNSTTHCKYVHWIEMSGYVRYGRDNKQKNTCSYEESFNWATNNNGDNDDDDKVLASWNRKEKCETLVTSPVQIFRLVSSMKRWWNFEWNICL